MQNLSKLIACARVSGLWITRRIGRVLAESSRLRHAFEPCRLPAPVPLPVVTPRLRRVVAVPVLMLAVMAAAPAHAYQGNRLELTADGRLVDVQVLVGNQATPLYIAPGRWDRRYFQALRGRNYALSLTNNSGRRIAVLIAVDGLNVVSGQRSSLASGEAMYVLDPWDHAVIRGWRSSLDDVRKFVFVDEDRSYAERTGQANGDLGWIRVLAFNEAGRPWYERPGRVNGRQRDDESTPYGSGENNDGGAPQAERRDQGQAAPESAAPPVTPRPEAGGETDSRSKPEGAKRTLAFGDAPAEPAAPGTGWGDKRHDPVRRVWFVPEAVATDQLVFRYEYASGLRALGIEPRSSRDRIWERERGELGFAEPPRW